MLDIGQLAFGAALSFSAVGSAFGVGVAGMAAVGAWKKCFVQNKNAPFLLIAFISAPLTQTIYGFLLMNAIKGASIDPLGKLGSGVFGGMAIGFSAFFQGKVGANASDALAETGKGFGNYLLAVGLVETIALFVMVFLIITLG
ncbi:MAG: V-type ATP synthase subunit K [Spirochaetales bacterium]|nr:V-type ATP synthase subunit K [Spirochaetales bacterium]